jgi:hypothetical protein
VRREGRPPDRRAELARGLIAVCAARLGLPADRRVVGFTQHAGDEMDRAVGGWSADSDAAEAGDQPRGRQSGDGPARSPGGPTSFR